MLQVQGIKDLLSKSLQRELSLALDRTRKAVQLNQLVLADALPEESTKLLNEWETAKDMAPYRDGAT